MYAFVCKYVFINCFLKLEILLGDLLRSSHYTFPLSFNTKVWVCFLCALRVLCTFPVMVGKYYRLYCILPIYLSVASSVGSVCFTHHGIHSSQLCAS